MADQVPALKDAQRGASWGRDRSQVIGANGAAEAAQKAAVAKAAAAAPKTNGAVGTDRQALTDSVRAIMLIRAYRRRGHLEATLDPLGLERRQPVPELHPTYYGFTEA